MSISSMTNVAIARRTDFGGSVVPTSVDEMATATEEKKETQSLGSTALKAIETYIPTEIIALYLAALAAVRAGQEQSGTDSGTIASQGELTSFWLFLALTPIVIWLVYAGKAKTGGARLPMPPKQWPFWEILSGVIGFAAWAYVLPDSAFTRFEWYTEALGSFVVLVASTALGLLAPIFQKR